MNKDEILKSEYSFEFDDIRKNMMCISFHKYGPLAINYTKGLIDAVKSLEKRLDMYKETGNTEYLADIANFAMIEFIQPQHPKAFYKPTDDGKSHIVGMGINEIKRFKEESQD